MGEWPLTMSLIRSWCGWPEATINAAWCSTEGKLYLDQPWPGQTTHWPWTDPGPFTGLELNQSAQLCWTDYTRPFQKFWLCYRKAGQSVGVCMGVGVGVGVAPTRLPLPWSTWTIRVTLLLPLNKFDLKRQNHMPQKKEEEENQYSAAGVSAAVAGREWVNTQ